MQYSAVYSLLEKWKKLMNSVTNWNVENCVFSQVWMQQIQGVYVELQFLMAILIVFEINNNNNNNNNNRYYEGRKMNDLVRGITCRANEAQEIIESFMKLIPLGDILEEVKSIKEEVMKIFEKKAYDNNNNMKRSRVILHLESSRQMLNYDNEDHLLLLSMGRKNQVQSVCDELELLRTFLMDRKIIDTDEHARVESLVDSIVCIAYKASWVICFFKRHRPFGKILNEIKSINTVMWKIYDDDDKSSTSSSFSPASGAAGDDDHHPNLGKYSCVDFLLEKLKKLINPEEDEYYLFSPIEMYQTEFVYEELGSLRTFLLDVEMIRHHHQTLQHLVNQIIDLAYEAEDIIYSLKFCRAHLRSYRQNLGYILKEIKSIKTAVAEIYEKKLYGVGDPQINIVCSNNNTSCSSRTGDSIAEDESVVGFDSEVDTIKECLAGGSNQLDVISIVGMAGLGKTTLAKILYNDPYVVYHFYIRGWTCVSQIYRRRDLLLGILTCFVENKDELYTMGNEKLAEELYKRLKGQKYLIVVDDIWDVSPWNDLKRCFPNDNNGSRIILTSRHTNVAIQVKSKSPPHPLRFLTEEESWYLFEQKVFRKKESCPPYLVEKGREIVQKCGGLPLAIVVIAGLLSKTDKTLDWWRQVAGSVSSYIASDPEHCIDTLALSYHHLPRHLKSCFLYFGAFPEDHEIRVTKLICLWIAEGFIRQFGQRTLEDIAEEYLMDLVDRSLVLVSSKRSLRGIKACRVHDLLRDLCSRKAKEENFLPYTDYAKEGSPNFSHVLVQNGVKKLRRLSVNSSTEFILGMNDIRSILFFRFEGGLTFRNNMLSKYGYACLKVLDLSAIDISHFPSELLKIVLLRYLALQGKELSVPVNISNLFNLETLVVSKVRSGSIPSNIWMMVKLRHLRIGGENDIEFPGGMDNDGFPSTLNKLQTMSQVCPSPSLEKVLARTLNLRKLVLCINSSRGQRFSSLRLDFLNNLEVLYLLNRHRYGQLNSFEGFTFPPNLKRITMSNTGLQWKEMSILGVLPNLEALKLEYEACEGPRWDTCDNGFPRLKYLRLHYMNIQQWNSSSFHFPNLRHLVLSRCKELEEIPSDFGNISTLDTVEVSWCSYSSVESARHIQEEQQILGNDLLKIHINQPE